MKKKIRFLTKYANENYKVHSGIEMWKKKIQFLTNNANENYKVHSEVKIWKKKNNGHKFLTQIRLITTKYTMR